MYISSMAQTALAFYIYHISPSLWGHYSSVQSYTNKSQVIILQVHPLSPPSPVLTSLKMLVELWMSLWDGHWVMETVLISTTNAPQAPYGGHLNITTASVTQHDLTGFMASYAYNITIRGSCGNQIGSESNPLTIIPQGLLVFFMCYMLQLLWFQHLTQSLLIKLLVN